MGTDPARPRLDPADDLTGPASVGIDATVAALDGQRRLSPIVRPSRASEVEALLGTGFPEGGETLEELAGQIIRANARFPRRNTHPGFFGWVAPSGLPSDPLAHAMVASLGENVGGYWSSPVGTTVERTVIAWLAGLAGFPEAAEGVILSGGSIANLTGMASALMRTLGTDYRSRGLAAAAAGAIPVVICSRETHFSVRRAAVMLGLGENQVVAIDTDDQFRMRLDRLEAALGASRRVACVVASAGTTNTGAIDPLPGIAELCRRHGVWLHVDAAYGGGGMMSAQLRPRYAGIERADSITMDLHKWFFQALAGSLILFRDARAARRLFADGSDYLDLGAEIYKFFHLGPELSRRFRALPFYLSMRHYGIPRLGRNALHNVRCAEYLAARVAAHDEMELVAAPQLAILCFRYRPAGLDEAAVDRLNNAIRERIQLEGDYLMSPTLVHGRPVLRCCIMNHATRARHIDGLFDSVLRHGRELAAGASAG